MKRLIALVLALVCVFGLVGCNNIAQKPTNEVSNNIEVTNDFYADVKTIEICVGSTKFHFDKAEDVESICKLFEDIVGNKVPDDEEQVEGFYEITFSKDGKETTVILTGPTIIIDGIRYYTTKAITQPLSEYLVEPTTNTHTLKVTENSVGEIGRETYNFPVEISEDDANALSQIINNRTWVEETNDCESDCAVNLKGNLMYYDSSSGTLNKYNLADMSIYSSKEPNVSGKSLVLSDEDRATVNVILEKYITLGIESN